MATFPDRVKIWNTFFRLAREEAHRSIEIQAGRMEEPEFSAQGGELPFEQASTLSLLSLLDKCIDSWANLLLHELHDKGKLSEDELGVARRLPPQAKWFLMPRLAGFDVQLDSSQGPHQAVVEICKMRNIIFHVDYDRLLEKLPSPRAALSLFNRFVDAMEDLNDSMGRIAPHPEGYAKQHKIILPPRAVDR